MNRPRESTSGSDSDGAGSSDDGQPPAKKMAHSSFQQTWTTGNQLSDSDDANGHRPSFSSSLTTEDSSEEDHRPSFGQSRTHEVDDHRPSFGQSRTHEEDDHRPSFGQSRTHEEDDHRPSFGQSRTHEEDDHRPSFGQSRTHEEDDHRTSFGQSRTLDDEDSSPLPQMGMSAVASDFIQSTDNSAVSYDPKVEMMMKSMGHVTGTGLGRHGQGRVVPVEASAQRGRRGLGHQTAGFEPSKEGWSLEKDHVITEESITWLPSPGQRVLPKISEMLTWIEMGKKKITIDDETEFCTAQTLHDVINCKTIFDNLEGDEMRRARTRSNPYETIRGVIFQNRAAMKMANIDAVLDFMFTEAKTADGRPLVAPSELLYFADVCAGPGGFSEYILWRKKWNSKGFGFTLRGPMDFKLEEFHAAPSEFFEPFYGVKEDGDVYNPENLKSLREFVMQATENKGLHFVMADGGFSVDGQENLQEVLSKRLYLCQFLAALTLLRPGGHFVCKLFDVFTTFSVGLVYLMFHAFDRVAIFKPVTSRPANSERYIVCRNMLEDTSEIHDYMWEINLRLASLGSFSEEDISSIVPLEVLRADEEFYTYIFDSNEDLGKKQAIALTKIQVFARNLNLIDTRQGDIRKQCLELWKIPDEVRTAPDKSEPAEKRFTRLAGKGELDLKQTPTELDFNHINDVANLFDFRCMLTASDERMFLLSQGRGYIYKFVCNQPGNRWTKVNDVKVQLPPDTLLEVELVLEYRGESKGQRKVMAVHVIDGLFLCGDDIRPLHFMERMDKIRKFVKALTRPTRSDLAPIRVKECYRMEELKNIFDPSKLEMRKMKGLPLPRVCFCFATDPVNGQKLYITPRGVFFIKVVREPWMMSYSKSQRKKYFFHTHTRQSCFELPMDSVGDYSCCLKHRFVWLWSEGVQVLDNQAHDASKLSRDAMLAFIHERFCNIVGSKG